MLPGGFDRRSAGGATDGGGSFGGGFGHGHHHGGSSWSPVFIPYAVPWSGYGYGPNYGPFGYGGWLPPVVLPAETLYGPQAVTRFVGFDPPPEILANINLAPVAPAAPQQGGFGQLAPGNVVPPDRPKVRASNDESRAQVRKYIGFGDEHFRKQRFADSVQRYRSAIDAAPDVADAYFRQALALAAMGRYETAVKAIERGLDVAPDWPRSGFRLDTLYGDNQLAKTAHLEALAKTAAADPNDPNLMFLLGVYLYCDGQPERSRPFFLRGARLGPGRPLCGRFPGGDGACGERRECRAGAECPATPGGGGGNLAAREGCQEPLTANPFPVGSVVDGQRFLTPCVARANSLTPLEFFSTLHVCEV